MKNEIKKLKDKIYNKSLDLYKQDKAIKTNNSVNCLYYRRICVCLDDKEVEVYDTSTDIYRPLSLNELKLLIEIGFDEFCDKVVIDSYWETIKDNRELMNIAIAKKNEREIIYHYKIAKEAIKNLREFLDINKK
jgi:hypothetical protein